MANEPKSPITLFAERLTQQPALKSNGVPVYAWRKGQAKNTTARRIVIFPTRSGLPAAASNTGALCDVDQAMSAECWGGDGEQTWALMTWLIQALESQGVGSDGDPGFYWNLLGSDWETLPDTASRGEVVSVLFQVKFAVAAMPYDFGKIGAWPTGQIDSVQQTITASE
jgi:hypothetical protein